MASRQHLSPAEETAIVDLCDRSLKLFFPVSKHYIINFAKSLFSASHPNPESVRFSGNAWYRRFLARHPELANRVARSISRQSVNVSARDIEEWAEELKKVCKEYEIEQADQFWNFDEKGFMLGVAQKTRVVVRRGEAGRDATFIQDGNREWITVVESVNAAGDTANPMIIFAGNNLMESWVEDPIKNAHYCVSPSGWTDDKKVLD
ncbi:hypothetical protein BT69DRAFT_1230829 [Atractiella rhizophila]|nr:hypothetical protein BT69DRAFT_1230829 [Atractiella rhizophila]